MNFGGSMPRNHGTDLRGVPIHLYLYNWPALTGGFLADRRPSLDLYGSFGDGELVMEDRGSLARAFKPDGTLYGPKDRGPRGKEDLHVTFQETSVWGSAPACSAR